KTLANLWTRLRSPRPNRASGGYLLTGTSAAREDELLGVTGTRRTRLPGAGTATATATEPGAAAGTGAGGWPNECLINVTDFSDFQAAVTVTDTEPEEPITVTALRVPSITTTATGNSTSNNINNINNITSHNNNNSSSNNNHNSGNNMSRILQPRYRFRDLLLGDFSFNDDGER
ncbi:hypothetical protein KR093_000070, partial [Drosophila rubida]